MALKVLSPAAVALEIATHMKLDRKNKDDLLEGVRPFRLNVFDSPTYRIRNGFPVAAPIHDVRSQSLASSQGIVLGSRPGPTDIETGAQARWVAGFGFSDVDLRWYPWSTEIGGIKWETSVGYLPTEVEDYTYAVDNRRFTVAAMNFDATSREHMWTDLTAFSGGFGYTIIVVGTVNSVYGNSENRKFAGLMGNGYPTTTDGAFFEDFDAPWEVRLTKEDLVAKSSNSTASLPIGNLVKSTPPFFIAMSLGRPESVLYVGKGPRDLRSISVKSTGPATYDTHVVLGRSRGDTLHTADMAVMDVGVYGETLTAQQVRREVAALSSVYGGTG